MLVDVPDFVLFFGRFHPLVVHLPIGFLLLAVIIAFISRSGRFAALAPSLDFILLLGAISAVLACILGYMLSLGGGYNSEALFWHQWLGIGLAVMSLLIYWFRAKIRRVDSIFSKLVSPYAFLVVLVLLTFTGHYGANLTHGSTYLFQYAPNPVRMMAGMEPKALPRPPVTVLDSADVFLDVIHPMIQSKCESCHNQDKNKGELLLTSYEEMLQGGETGSSLVPGDLEESLLYQRVTLPKEHDDFMPAEGKTGLTADEVEILKWWIEHDAPATIKLAGMQLEGNMSAKFERLLGISSDDSRLPDKEVTAADSSLINTILSQGFMVKRILPGSNYLEARLSFNKQDLSDVDLQLLLPIKDQIAWIDFSGGQVNDSDLIVLAEFKSVTRLNLSNNPITDQGLLHLADLKELSYLNLYGTTITDLALPQLSEFKKLKSVYLWQTKVTEGGVASFQSDRPDLQVILGQGFSPLPEGDGTETDTPSQ